MKKNFIRGCLQSNKYGKKTEVTASEKQTRNLNTRNKMAALWTSLFSTIIYETVRSKK